MSKAVFAKFKVTDHGMVFRSASGWQAYYPRVVSLGGRELLASFVASKTIESQDSHPELARSLDGGINWTAEGPVTPRQAAPAAQAEFGFISLAMGEALFYRGTQFALDPAKPDLPLVNPKTIGMRPNEATLRRSFDKGRTWTAPVTLPKPYPVPLELPTGILTLNDGTLILSCSTWKEWDGNCPYGHRVTMIRSGDDGKTWQGPVDIFHDPSGRLGFWEARIVELGNGTLLATCWAHDWQTDQDLPNHYALSHDAGRTWSAAMPAPVKGQTAWPMRLDDEHILLIYNHRREPVGVRAQVASAADGGWESVYDGEIWTPEEKKAGKITRDDYAVVHFQFGAPSAIRISKDTFLAVYWCVAGGRAGINWARGRLE
jgi:hypothetical protein